MMNTIGGLGLSANIMADKTQNKAQVEKAEGFAQELSKAEKNTMDDPAYQKKLKDACRGFESMFMQMMWKEMRGTVPENALFGESHGEKIFKDMLDTEMVDRMSEAGGVGLADMMYKQLTAQYQAKKDMAERARASMEAKGQHINLPS